MDLEGLGRLIEEKHAQTEIMFKHVEKSLREQKDFCSLSMKSMHDKIIKHETTLTQIKTIGSLLNLVWGAIVVLVSTWLGRR